MMTFPVNDVLAGAAPVFVNDPVCGASTSELVEVIPRYLYLNLAPHNQVLLPSGLKKPACASGANVDLVSENGSAGPPACPNATNVPPLKTFETPAE